MIRGTVAAALLAMAMCGQSPDVTIRNGDKPGVFEISNRGTAVTLLVQAQIEKKSGGSWIYTGIVYELIEKCGPPPQATVVLRPRQQLKPVPWTGFDCEVQCPRPCRMNQYAGPGEFRLVIQTADKKHRVTGAGFSLGAGPKGPARLKE